MVLYTLASLGDSSRSWRQAAMAWAYWPVSARWRARSIVASFLSGATLTPSQLTTWRNLARLGLSSQELHPLQKRQGPTPLGWALAERKLWKGVATPHPAWNYRPSQRSRLEALWRPPRHQIRRFRLP